MIVVKGNLFDQECDAIAIPTSGYFTYENLAVMGKGVALQAAKKWPVLKKRLGYMLQTHGTHVYMLTRKKKLGGEKLKYQVVSFPVKPRYGIAAGRNVTRMLRDKFPQGKHVPGWAMVAQLKLIKRSALELRELAEARGWKRVALPKVGCGAGELEWRKVETVLKKVLKGKVKFVVVEVD